MQLLPGPSRAVWTVCRVTRVTEWSSTILSNGRVTPTASRTTCSRITPWRHAWRRPTANRSLLASHSLADYYAAVRLYFQQQLADARSETTGLAAQLRQVMELAGSLAERDGPRWRSVVLEALLSTGPAPQLLCGS